MDIGFKIKDLRKKMNLTQEELANRCELTKGFISQVERDLTSPSISTLISILDTLGIDLKDFFSENENEKVVFREEDIFIQENVEQGLHIEWIISNAQKNKMEPMLISLEKKLGRTETYPPFEGEIFGYAIQGIMDLYIGEKKYKVRKGEGFYFHANSFFYLENNYNSKAIVLWVSTPPNF